MTTFEPQSIDLTTAAISAANFSASSATTSIMSSEGEDTRIPLYLSAYFTLGGSWDGSGILPAVEMALDHINADADILSGYVLRMVWNDTKVSARSHPTK